MTRRHTRSVRRRPAHSARRRRAQDILRGPLARWPLVILTFAALAAGNLLLAGILAAVAVLAWKS